MAASLNQLTYCTLSEIVGVLLKINLCLCCAFWGYFTFVLSYVIRFCNQISCCFANSFRYSGRFPWSQVMTNSEVTYVYWTVHRLDRWIERDQLDVTCFIISLFTVQHVSDVNTSILRSLRLIWWVTACFVLFWFEVCWCYGVVWLGWCGIWMQAEAVLQPAKPHRNTNTHRTRAIQPMQ